MTALSVNVNKIAWLRNARAGSRPNVLECCQTIVDAGANGLTVHPRPDQRHIKPEDVQEIASHVQSLDIEFNVEGNPASRANRDGYPGFMELVEQTCPDQCTLVPDSDDQLTSDHGWELRNAQIFARVQEFVARLKTPRTRVSLFLDPHIEQVDRAKDSGADRIELYTGPWADAVLEHGLDSTQANTLLAAYKTATHHAQAIGLRVNAGHDLDLVNLAKFVSIGSIAEVSIGHALISDALDFGLHETVRKYLEILKHI